MKQTTTIQFTIFTLLLTIAGQVQACLNEPAINQLKKQEIAYFTARHVPTMTHALQDQLFEIDITPSNEASNCSVIITYKISEADIAEANQIFDASPGKRIMLTGQGYQLPASKQIRANASINPTEVNIAHADTLQSAPLGRNRASIELMYATLAQSRALITPNALNTQPWPADLTTEQISACKKSYASDADIAEACGCRVKSLGERISHRQFSYIQYLASDPYSSATGALSGYNGLSNQINFDCKLSRR